MAGLHKHVRVPHQGDPARERRNSQRKHYDWTNEIHNLLTTGSGTFGTLVLAGGSITDSSGTINFGNENLTTTGTVTGEQISSTDDITMAGRFTNTPGATDASSFIVTQTYTGTDTLNPFSQTVTITTNAPTTGVNVNAIQNTVVNNHNVAPTFPLADNIIGINNIVSTDITRTGALMMGSATETVTGMSNLARMGISTQRTWSATGSQITDIYGLSNTASMTATTITAGTHTINLHGSYNIASINYSNLVVNGANASVTINQIGDDVVIAGGARRTAGSLAEIHTGVKIDVTNGADGTTTNYGLYLYRVSGADSNYSIWDASGAPWVLAADNQKIILGAAQEATIYYSSGSNLILDPAEVSSGRVYIGPTANAGLSAGDLVSNGNVTATTDLIGPKAKITSTGGVAVKLTNKTGVASVKGQLVLASPGTNNAVTLTGAGAIDCFGVFLDAGVGDGSEAWVVVSGIAEVLMDDNHGTARGEWVGTGAAGYATTQAIPPAAPTHFEEIGHCLETVAATGAGTHVLAKCVLHFN